MTGPTVTTASVTAAPASRARPRGSKTRGDTLLASGYLWEENAKQLAFKPFAAVQPNGRGFVVAFTQDPTVRAYLDGLNVIFMNAILRGAAHARPPR